MGSDINAPYLAKNVDPSSIIVELCKQFYESGWMPGTSGSASIRVGNEILVTPSGVQKERMRPTDMISIDLKTGEQLKDSIYKPTASIDVFRLIHDTLNVDACFHTHSVNAVLVTALFKNKLQVTRVENMKAIPKYIEPGNLGVKDTLEIPIIPNQDHEELLVPDLKKALAQYPGCPAVLVENHGLYVWGRDVWKAKIVNEALEYLMEVAVGLQKCGLRTTNREDLHYKSKKNWVKIVFLTVFIYSILILGMFAIFPMGIYKQDFSMTSG